MSETGSAGVDARATLLPMRIVHAAIASTVLMFGAVLSMLTSKPPDTPVERATPPQGLTLLLAGLAAGALVAALLVRRRARTGKRRELFSEPAPAAPAGARRGGSAAAPYVTTCILSWALAEVIAALGLILGFLHWQLPPFLPFGAVSLAALLYMAPRRAELEAVLARSPGT